MAAMLAYRLKRPGSIAGLIPVEEDLPAPGPGEVRVRLAAVSLNARDLMIVEGRSPYGDATNIIPVSDGAGDVTAIGDGVVGLVPGDRVVASFRPDWVSGPLRLEARRSDLGGGRDGLLAQEAVLPAISLVRIPEAFPLEAAACLPCAGVTAWNGLFGGSGLTADDSVLVEGSGGVAVFALQIARAVGCRVIATTSSSAKVDRLRALGASEVVLAGRGSDWDSEVLALTRGRGVDRIVETGGPGNLARAFGLVAPLGEIALVGLLDDATARVNPLPLMGKMASLRGVSVGSRMHLEQLAGFAAANFLPEIDRRFPFAEAREALEYLASGAHLGKVVINL